MDCSSLPMGFPLNDLPQVLLLCYVLTYSWLYAERLGSTTGPALCAGPFQPKVSERP